MTLFSRTTVFALLAGALLLSACAGLQPTSQPVTITLLPGSPPPIASASPITTIQPTTTPGAATAEIELTITGGPADGSYRAVVHGTSCVQPSAGQFVANYADPVAVDGFTRLDIDVRDAAAAIDSETDDFALDLTVAGTSYSIDPSSGEGEGSALLEIDPLANATLDVFATAEDGVELELSLLCDVEPL